MRCITIEKEQNNCSKYSAFASFALLYLFFNSNSVFFVGAVAKIFLAPGAGCLSYAIKHSKSANL